MTLLERLRWHADTRNGDAHVTCGEAADEIERLSATLVYRRPSGMKDMETRLRIADWRPIKTAPKDGTRVDLWFSRRGIGYRPNAFWSLTLQSWAWDCDIDGSLGHTSLPNLRPTHWLPPLNPDTPAPIQPADEAAS